MIFKISLRYLRGSTLDYFNKVISCFPVIGIAFGVMSLISSLSIMNSFEKKISNDILKYIPQIIVTNKKKMMHINDINSSILKSMNHVSYVSPIIYETVFVKNLYNIAIGKLVGVNMIDPDPVFKYLSKNTIRNLFSKKKNIVLGKRLATQLNVKIGDTVQLITLNSNIRCFNESIHIQKESFTIIEIFFTGKEIDNYLLLVNRTNANKFMKFPIGYITGWRLWLKNPMLIEKFKNKERLFSKEFIWSNWKEQKGELFQALYVEKIAMLILLSVIVIMSLINMMISLMYLITNKQKEIAILLVQGMRPIQIMYIFSIQGIMIGIIGAFVGIILGIFTAKKIYIFIPMFSHIKVFIDIYHISLIFILVVLSSFLFSIFPAKLASKINPSVVLRNL